MENAVTIDVKDVLEDQGYGVFVPNGPSSSEYAIYVGFMDEDYSNAICIRGTGGDAAIKTTVGQHDRESFQLLVRSKSYTAGYNKLNAIKEYLKTINKSLEITDSNVSEPYRYEGFFQVDMISDWPKDNKGRYYFSVNFETMRTIL